MAIVDADSMIAKAKTSSIHKSSVMLLMQRFCEAVTVLVCRSNIFREELAMVVMSSAMCDTNYPPHTPRCWERRQKRSALSYIDAQDSDPPTLGWLAGPLLHIANSNWV